ncbi:P-type ATPase [Nowakowskiella sp. JEL0407]|nr:P-type ATPase [Nowakowskiella sp. JEL0407]
MSSPAIVTIAQDAEDSVPTSTNEIFSSSANLNDVATPLQNNQDWVELKSVKVDGRVSIEHQIEIHVNDLISIEEQNDISLLDVLQGLKYVMDYRIKGGKMKRLDSDLMKRLLEGLLQNMDETEGSLLRRRPTEEADLAFTLFGEFLEEVEQFRTAVSRISAVDLREALKIHRRTQPWSTDDEKQAAVGVIGILVNNIPSFADWKDLVKQSEWGDVEDLLEKYSEKFKEMKMPPSDEVLFPPPALYFEKTVEKLEKMFKTNIQTGLSADTTTALLEHYGPNKIPEPPKPSILKMLWTQISDYMVFILIVAAAAEFATNDPKAAVVLLFVVVLNIIIGFSQEYKANQALEALMSLSVPQAVVIRDGKQEKIDSSLLVPGDIVVLDEGDAVPADLRLCEVSQLEIVEAILTGEPLPVSKKTDAMQVRTHKLPLGDCKCSAFMSTVVAKGRGKGIVVRTGDQTEIGRISKAIVSTPHVKTPIQMKLNKLGLWLVAIAILLCVIIVIIGVVRGNGVIDMLKIGVSLAVSVIPEGLVVVVTLTMALGVRRMAAANAIVRKLPSVETLGAVTVICSDKTGTLTEGKMGTAQLWTAENSLFTFSHSTSLDPSLGSALKSTLLPLSDALKNPKLHSGASDPKTSTEVGKTIEQAPRHLVLGMMIATLCNNASIMKNEEDELKPVGDPTEVAMVVAAQKSGFSREFFHDKVGLEKVGEYPFDSERKLMSVIYTQSAKTDSSSLQFPSNSTFILVKGAPEGVLSKCTSYLPSKSSHDGKSFFEFVTDNSAVEAMNDEFATYVSERAGHMASQGLRVLAFAMRNLRDRDEGQKILDEKNDKASESDLVFVGLIGLIDPPKAGVREAVTSCKQAGVKVVMITGDHIATASAIARDLGIIDSVDTRSLKGYEVDLLSDEALAELSPFPVVFARVSPDNKLKIVRALQAKGNIVAMTGDGVNDAPAIKQADVGIAMGISGTEITKQAADIVLADDNFTTIVGAVKEGRRVFDNIAKFVVYLLSCNSAEIWLFLITVAAGYKENELPFTIIMILWANIIADVPPALSLGVEGFEEGIMERPPRNPSQGVLTALSTIAIIVQGIVIMSLPLIVFVLTSEKVWTWYPNYDVVSERQSLTFLVLTVMQLTQSFFSRSTEQSLFKTGVIGNKWMIYAYVLSFGFLVAGYYIPGLNEFLDLKPVGWQAWVITLICVLIQFVIVEILKLALTAAKPYLTKTRQTPRRRRGYGLTYSTENSPNVVEGTLWFNNIYPVFVRSRTVRAITKIILPDRNIESLIIDEVVPTKFADGSKLIYSRVEKNKKEGGFYLHFKIGPESAEESEAVAGEGEQSKKSIVEKKFSVNEVVSTKEELAKIVTRKMRTLFPYRGITVFAVRGEPWIEDLVARPPYRKLRVEFFGEDVPIEKLFKEFRPYGQIADIVALPWSSKEQPRYAEIHFEIAKDAASAKNCVHGDVIDGTRLSVHYDKNNEQNYFFHWAQQHPRISIPLIIAIFAAITYVVFDPIRRFSIINKATDRFSFRKYFDKIVDRLDLPTWMKSFLPSSAASAAAILIGRRKGLHESGDDLETFLSRKGESVKLAQWLKERPENFVLITGPRGSGTEQLVARTMKGRPCKVIIDCNELIDRNEEKMLSTLASQVGFFPLFSFYNSIAGIGDLAAQSLTGTKAGLATTTEGQVDRILSLTLTALSDLGRKENKEKRNLVENATASLTDKSPSALQIEAERDYPVVVIEGFMSKPKGKHAFLYDKMVEWAALLEESQTAHVVFVSDNPGHSQRALQKALPSKTLELIFLTDADNERSLSYVQRRLGLVFASNELQTAVEGLGGRLTDLEILIQKIKAGSTATDAYQEIILRSIAEIRKIGFGDDAEESSKIPWTPEQCWKVIQLLAKYDEVGIDELKSSPLFGGDENSLQQMEVSNLIAISHQNGRPYSIRPARPIYKTAFSKMTSDAKLSATLNIVTLKSLKKKEQAKIESFEKEMESLTRVMSAGGSSSLITSREGRKGMEYRLDFLAKLLAQSTKKFEKLETEEEKQKLVLKLAE